ncbi:MAG: hypothetical protein ACI303_00220 [Lepagella sp.]
MKTSEEGEPLVFSLVFFIVDDKSVLYRFQISDFFGGWDLTPRQLGRDSKPIHQSNPHRIQKDNEAVI